MGGENDESCKRFLIALTAFLNRIAAGTLPDKVAFFFASTVLIALDKGNDKIRPIAVGDTLRKTAIGIVLEKSDMSYFSKFQHGIGVPNGCEKIAHKTQILRDQYPHFDSVLLDATNAFNSIDRLKAAREF